jgi:pimeloyl-ACP methyl ester carboxylesterase
MVSGSGPETRRIPRQVGDLLAYHGVAVLVTDKRGTGGSTGSWNGLSHADWATDVEALLDFLRTQPEIDPGRIGLWGNSEGGYVAPVVAARRPDVRFLVCRVCAGLPHGEVIPDIETESRRRRGMAEADVAAVQEVLERMIRYALTHEGYDSLVARFQGGAGEPWRESFPLGQIPPADGDYWDVYRGVLLVDPREEYARLDIPALVVLGERDDRVLIEKHRPVFEALAASGVDLTLWVIPEASHGLMLGPGNALGYPAGLHDRMVQWVQRAAGAGGGPQRCPPAPPRRPPGRISPG